jgi:serine/threonine protein phosphatase PrpC
MYRNSKRLLWLPEASKVLQKLLYYIYLDTEN